MGSEMCIRDRSTNGFCENPCRPQILRVDMHLSLGGFCLIAILVDFRACPRPSGSATGWPAAQNGARRKYSWVRSQFTARDCAFGLPDGCHFHHFWGNLVQNTGVADHPRIQRQFRAGEFPDLENSRNLLWWAGKGSSLVDRKHRQHSHLTYLCGAGACLLYTSPSPRDS